MAKIWVASIQHRHGTNFYASVTEDGLEAQITAYCRSEWESEDVPGSPDALSDKEVREQYFAELNERGDRGDFLEGMAEIDLAGATPAVAAALLAAASVEHMPAGQSVLDQPAP